MQHKRTIGIVGCGAIGAAVAEGLHVNFTDSFTLGMFSDADAAKARTLADQYGGRAGSLDEVIAGCDILLETTTASVMPGVLRAALRAKRCCVIMSVGGFVFDPALLQEAEKAASDIHLPSGAIAGLDGVLALRELGLDAVSITTTKHPRSLANIPYLESKGIDLAAITEPFTVFEGPAGDAIRNFPANVNVAITLSLAGAGFARTTVRLVADPAASRTTHTVFARSGDCEMTATTTGVPLPQNPKSSLLAVESAFAVFRKLASPMRTGT